MRRDIMTQAAAIRDSMDKAAGYLTDQQASRAPLLYRKWEPDITVVDGERIYYAVTEKLYKVNDGMGHTTQVGWEPDKTPAMYTVIDVEHTGAQDDPIPATRGMEYTYGLYYTDEEDGKLYLCERTGEQVGAKITLQYLPHELVGQYFTAVE